ncbi:hypothetical protein DEGR_26470 [Deinococcus grandis]|nr:hypothetical protein DEGR_26470 [Deinococcus grandis]
MACSPWLVRVKVQVVACPTRRLPGPFRLALCAVLSMGLVMGRVLPLAGVVGVAGAGVVGVGAGAWAWPRCSSGAGPGW